jgi:hypothetical protein
MAHFYGSVFGGRGEANRVGHKNTGIRSYVQSWGSRLTVWMDHDEREGSDSAVFTLGEGPRGPSNGSLRLSFDDVDGCRAALGADPIAREIGRNIEELSRQLNMRVGVLNKEAKVSA